MPTATRSKKRPAKRSVKRVVRQAHHARAKKTKLKAKPKSKKKAIKVKIKMLGRVTHYYDKISVAIIDVISPINVGDTVRIKHGEYEMEQPVMSMQIDHEPVAKAKKGDVIGLKVMTKVPEGAMVLPR